MSADDGSNLRAADEAGVGYAQRVLSPEQVGLDLPIAGPGPRILAYAIDYMLIFIVQMLLIFFVIFAVVALESMIGESWIADFFEGWSDELEDIGNEQASPEVLQGFVAFIIGLFILFQLVAEWVYFISSEMLSGGASLGKKALKIRVVRSGGLPITFRASLTRNLLRIVDILPGQYLVGLASMVISPETRRLGDFAADTIVVRLDRPAAAAGIEPLREGEHGVFGLDAAMRAQVGPAELKLARATLRRLDDLDEAHGQAALERAVDVIREKIGYDGAVPPAQRQLFLRTVIEAGTAR